MGEWAGMAGESRGLSDHPRELSGLGVGFRNPRIPRLGLQSVQSLSHV